MLGRSLSSRTSQAQSDRNGDEWFPVSRWECQAARWERHAIRPTPTTPLTMTRAVSRRNYYPLRLCAELICVIACIWRCGLFSLEPRVGFYHWSVAEVPRSREFKIFRGKSTPLPPRKYQSASISPFPNPIVFVVYRVLAIGIMITARVCLAFNTLHQ